MKTIVFVIAAIVLIGCTQESNQADGEGIDWIADYASGTDQARAEGKSSMLFFTADWCPPCTELKEYVFSDKRVVAASRPLVNIVVDVDHNPEVVREYKVRGIPKIFFLNAQGRKIGTFDGPRSVKNLVKHMEAAAEAANAGS